MPPALLFNSFLMTPPIARRRKTIMQDEKTILLDKQQRVFRIACDPKRYGLTLKLIAMDSGLHYDSVRHYAAGETALPLSAFVALMGVVPDELLSLLLPDGRAIVKVPDEIDHDTLADAVAEYLHDKNAAHHPESECGRDLGPNETTRLDAKVVHLPIVGRAA